MLISPISGTEAALAAAKTAQATSASSKPADPVAESKNFYFSPALVIDPKSGTDVLEYRNSSTGVVTNQYPSEKDIKAYAQHSLKQADASADTAVVTDGTSDKAVSSDVVSQASASVAAKLQSAPATTQTPDASGATPSIIV